MKNPYLTIIFFLLSYPVMAQNCTCNDFLYLNEERTGIVHKFEINPADGSLTEIPDATGAFPFISPTSLPAGAGQQVELLDGFEIETGGEFYAYILTCN